MKIVIWGVGQIFQRYRYKIPDEDIVCIIDNIKKNDISEKREIALPEQLINYEYDFIVIFSSKYYDEISYQLIMEMGIDCKKVISWKYYLGINFYNCIGDIINQYCGQNEKKEILDIGGVFSNYQILELKGFCDIDLVQNNREDIFIGGYRYIFKTYTEAKRDYDLLLIDSKEFWVYSVQCLASLKTDLLIILSFNDIPNIISKLDKQLAIINFRGYLFGYYKSEIDEIKIFEATHKKFVPIKEQVYIPIHAGALYSSQLDYLRDDSGDNISKLNAQINECTALYWIWKNIKSNIVGMNHYRRFFKSQINSYMLQGNEIDWLLNKYDILVSERICIFSSTIEEQLKSTVCSEAFNEAIRHLYEIFETRGKTDESALKYVFQGHTMYPYNMFISSKKIVNEYCDWLFPILFELIEKVTICEEWDSYSKRIIGFIAERLFTVWLVQKNYKVKELAVLITGDGKSYGK